MNIAVRLSDTFQNHCYYTMGPNCLNFTIENDMWYKWYFCNQVVGYFCLLKIALIDVIDAHTISSSSSRFSNQREIWTVDSDLSALIDRSVQIKNIITLSTSLCWWLVAFQAKQRIIHFSTFRSTFVTTWNHLANDAYTSNGNKSEKFVVRIYVTKCNYKIAHLKHHHRRLCHVHTEFHLLPVQLHTF